jgi:two-component system, OmpR family, alkaline phosphatase synthesis response regulator PhoP
MSHTILLVDDDKLLVRGLAYSLERAGYQVVTAGDAAAGVSLARASAPDLVLLDIGLPGMDGLEAMRIFQHDLKLRVILLTARRSGRDEALGLELGADDYVAKPFDMDSLLARIKAVLRRSARQQRPAAAVPLAVGELSINPPAHLARIGPHPLDLSPREFDLLYALTSQAGQVVPVETLLVQVWGAEFTGQPQVIYVSISKLRERLASIPGHTLRIVTVHRIGYKLVDGEA